jgi:hypothetical protein
MIKNSRYFLKIKSAKINFLKITFGRSWSSPPLIGRRGRFSGVNTRFIFTIDQELSKLHFLNFLNTKQIKARL